MFVHLGEDCMDLFVEEGLIYSFQDEDFGDPLNVLFNLSCQKKKKAQQMNHVDVSRKAQHELLMQQDACQ